MAGLLDWQTDDERAAQQRALQAYSNQIGQQQARQELFDALGQTLPAQIAKSIYQAARLPGDVYRGNVDPRSPEAIGRAADFAGAAITGSMPFAVRGALGSGGGKMVQPKVEGGLLNQPIKQSSSKATVDSKPEDTVKLFHGTTEEGYKGITEAKKIEGPAFLSPRRDVAKEYSLHNSPDPYVVEVNVPKKKLLIDFDLPGGRLLDIENANAYSGNTGWTIDDYISRGYSFGVIDGVPF